MNHTRQIKQRALLLVITMVALGVASSRLRADTGTCNGASLTLPFTDVPASNIFFCAIAAARHQLLDHAGWYGSPGAILNALKMLEANV